MTLGDLLQPADYVVFCLGICLSLAAGVFYAYKDRKHVSSFFFHRGEGQLSALPVAMSLIVTYESSLFYLGYPAEVYIHGFMFYICSIGYAIGQLSMLFIAIPLFYPLQVTSINEYLQLRHDSRLIRQVAMILGIILSILYTGFVVYGAAGAVESVTGMPVWISIIALSAVAVIYTSFGGIKAVVVTDVVQGVIMVLTIIIVMVYGTIQAGGLQRVVDLNTPSGRLKLFDFDPNPLKRHTFWTLLFGGMYRGFGMSLRQPIIQRFNSTKSIKEAKKVAWLSLLGFLVLDILVMLEGLVIYAYFANKGCDPLASGQITTSHQIVSYAVLDMFENIPGLTGLFLAAICSASLSTVSSFLSSLSANVSEDFIKVKWKAISDVKLTTISKLLVIICGAIGVVIALLISYIKGSLQQIAGIVIGIVSVPLASMFIMSIFIKSTTRKGIMVSVVVGLIVNLWISVGYNISPGRQRTPWLPLGPTDRCNIFVGSNLFNNSNRTIASTYFNQNQTTDLTKIDTQTIANTYFSHNQTADLTKNDTTLAYKHGGSNISGELEYINGKALGEKDRLKGLDYLYSVSYMYVPIIVLFVSLAAGIVTNRLTKIERQTPVPSYLMMSLNRQFLKCQPNYYQEVSDGGNAEVLVLQESSKVAEA